MNSTETVVSIFETLPTVVAIIGSRSFPQPHWVTEFVERLDPTTVVVSGGAKGVDSWAEETAMKRGLKTKIFPIESWEWDIYGKRAGMIRNMVLLAYIEEVGGHVIAFSHDDDSGNIRGGTKHTCETAQKRGIPLTVYHSR